MTDALILSGGGANGALQVGMAGVLLTEPKLNFHPTIYGGTSVGAINIALLSQYPTGQETKAAQRLFDLWHRIQTNKDIYTPNPRLVSSLVDELIGMGDTNTSESSLYDTKPLSNLIDREGDLEALRRAGHQVFVTVFCLDSGEVEYVDRTDPLFLDAVKGSAAFPFAFTPQKFHGRWILDGGVREVVPIAEAIHRGATRIFACVTDPPKMNEDTRKEWGPLSIALRALSASNHEVVRNDLERGREMARQNGVELHIIRPSKGAGDSFDFSREKNHKLIAWGDELVRSYLENIDLK